LPAENHHLRGYIYIAAATAFWGIAAVMGKAAFSGHLLPGAQALAPLDPVILSQARTGFSFLLLAPFLFWHFGRKQAMLPRADFGRCLLLGVLGLAGSNYFYYLAIAKTTVATAIILQYTSPVLVLLYMLARHTQRPTLRRLAAVAMSFAGSALAIGLGSGERVLWNAIGVGAALMAALSFSFYNIYGRKLVTIHNRWKVITWALFGSVLFWTLVNPPWKIMAANYSKEQWVFMVVFALVSMLIPFSFYFAGLQYLDATRAIVTSCLEPVFAILFAAMFIGEKLSALQIIGVVVVMVATILIQLPEKGRVLEPIIEPVD
jgi:drug/metabolite transporter, DME family